LSRENGGRIPFPPTDKVSQNATTRYLKDKNAFLESKLRYHEGGFQVAPETITELRSKQTDKGYFLALVRQTVIGSTVIHAPMPFMVGPIHGQDRACAIGLRDIIEGSAYCLSMAWHQRTNGLEAMQNQLEQDRQNPRMDIYCNMLRLVSFFIQDNDFKESDIASFETMIVLGELSLMLDYYMLNISKDLIDKLVENDPATVTFIEENDSNPGFYFVQLLNSFAKQWRDIDPPVTPVKVRAFCDKILGSIVPGLSFQALQDRADETRKLLFDCFWQGLYLPGVREMVTERIARTFSMRKALKFPILGLNLLDDEELATCYETNPVPILFGCTMHDESYLRNNRPLPDGHLLGALSELNKMTKAVIEGKTWRCDFAGNLSGCPFPRTMFCEGKCIREAMISPPKTECVRKMAMLMLVKLCSQNDRES
jgi:hypothetical protein